MLRPLAGRALWATLSLGAVIAVSAVVIWSDLREIDLMNRIVEGGDFTLEEAEANDDRQAVVSFLQLAAWIVCAFFFIRWFHAAYSNLRALGQPNLRHGTGWAIGAWFVPFLNLWRPKQIANDIWRGSDPQAPALTEAAWKDVPTTPLLDLWWGAWIIAGVVGNVVGRLWFSSETAEEIRDAARIDVASSVVDMGAAVLAILVVRRLTALQAERERRYAATPATEGTMPESYTGSSGQPG